MPTWKTAAEISRLYVVGEERLLAYSRRGNLPMLEQRGGSAQFDEDVVRCFFRPRVAAETSDLSARSLGILGEVRLGEAAQPLAARSERTTTIHPRRAVMANPDEATTWPPPWSIAGAA